MAPAAALPAPGIGRTAEERDVSVETKSRWLEQGSRPARVVTALVTKENAMRRAYRLWLEHAQQCEECREVSTAEDGCADGVDLWRDYRDVRISGPAGA